MSRPLRILIAADTYPPDVNGAARFTARLADGLAGRGHEVHVVAPSDTGPGSSPVPRYGVPAVHRLRSHRVPGQERFRFSTPGWAAAGTEQVLRAVRPDVVHVQSHFPVGRGLLGAAAGAGYPTVATNHFMPENLLEHARVPEVLAERVSGWAWRDLGRVYAAADAVTAPTPRARRPARRPHRAARPRRVLRHRPARFGGAGARDPEPTVLFVGRLEREKRVDELIRAFAWSPAGSGWRSSATAPAGRDGSSWPRPRPGRAGPVPRRRGRGRAGRGVPAVVGVLHARRRRAAEPGHAGGDGEGRPVVAADASRCRTSSGPGTTVCLPARDVTGLAAALNAVLDDPAARARMGEASREMVARHALDGTLDAFEDVYDGRPAVPPAGWSPAPG